MPQTCLLNADDVLHAVLRDGISFTAGPWSNSNDGGRPLGANVNGVYGGEIGNETSMYWKYSKEEGDPTLTRVVVMMQPPC